MPRIYNKYGDYVAWPGIGTGLIVACYFGWRYAQGGFEGHERGAIIAGVIVGVALIISMGTWAFLRWRQRRSLPPSERSTGWWINLWSRKRQARAVRKMLDLDNASKRRSHDHVDQMEAGQYEEYHRGSTNTTDTTTTATANDNIYGKDIESISASSNVLEKPAAAHTSSKNEKEWKDPNPTSLLNV